MTNILRRLTSVRFILSVYITAAVCVLITIRCFDAVRIGAFSRSYALAEISCCYGAGKNPFFIGPGNLSVTAPEIFIYLTSSSIKTARTLRAREYSDTEAKETSMSVCLKKANCRVRI